MTHTASNVPLLHSYTEDFEINTHRIIAHQYSEANENELHVDGFIKFAVRADKTNNRALHKSHYCGFISQQKTGKSLRSLVCI